MGPTSLGPEQSTFNCQSIGEAYAWCEKDQEFDRRFEKELLALVFQMASWECSHQVPTLPHPCVVRLLSLVGVQTLLDH